MKFLSQKNLLTSIFILLIFFSARQIIAQGWERTYGGNDYDYSYEVKQTTDGGFIIVGSTSSFGPDTFSVYLIKTDVNGDTLWTQTYGGSDWDEGYSVEQTNDGGYVVVGSTSSFGAGSSDVYLIKTDALGNLLWEKTFGGIDADDGRCIKQTVDNGFIIIGYTRNFGVNNYGVYLIKTNSNGDSLWTKAFNVMTNSSFGYSIQQTTDGGYIITGYNSFFNTLFLIKTDINGDILWTKTFGCSNGNSVQQTNDGGYVILGSTECSGGIWTGNKNVYLIKTNANGDSLWAKSYGGQNYDYGRSVQQTSDNGFILLGSTTSFGNSYQVYLIKTDSIGDTLWTKTFGGMDSDDGMSVQETIDGGFIITGSTYSFGAGFQDVYLIKTDNFGNSITDMISGNIYNDSNSNCISETNELKLSNKFVKLTPGNIIVSTDMNGNYSAMVGVGTYTVQSILPNNYWQQTCPNPPTYTVNFTSFYDTSSANDFGYEIAVYCPLMTIDISTWALRPCSTSTYTVQYCNNGTTTADSAYIEVEFDDDITPVSSTLNWILQNGNIYTFNIGNVAPQQCGNFYITANVSCSAVVGSAHCIEAHIFPDSICTPVDTSWDQSSVSVEGICVGDSLACFTIYNNGDAMQGASSWRIYENNTLVDSGTFQLAAGDSIIICHVSEGLTIRLEADQPPGHPGNSHPNANVEMCGGVPPAQMGFITQVPEDDADESIEMDCREITASLDPNEKLVKPAGISQNHFIDSADMLEYQINFQNTGTDTAFKIVVRDTLSQNLDITTVQSGVSSHLYSFRIYGQGILEWTFNNILLPDSNTNENASHSFVRFKAKQKTGNAIGTVIENRAAIYFDYNAPVITNSTFNTIWKEPLLSISKIYQASRNILIYPNPASGNVTITAKGRDKIIITDVTGRKIKEYNFSNNQLKINTDEYENGIYFLTLYNGNRLVAAEKLCIAK